MRALIKKTELIAVAFSFLSFVFRDPYQKGIRRIILYGSVARNEFDEGSDIDLFFDCGNEAETKKLVSRALAKFYASQEWGKWKLKGITNEIQPMVGSLEEWDLKQSAEKEGVQLYSSTAAPHLMKYYLFSFSALTPLSRRNRVIRRLFGRKGYNQAGIVERYGGSKITPRSFLIPQDGVKEATTVLSKEKAEFSFKEVWM